VGGTEPRLGFDLPRGDTGPGASSGDGHRAGGRKVAAEAGGNPARRQPVSATRAERVTAPQW